MRKQIAFAVVVLIALGYAAYRITIWYLPYRLMQYTYQRWQPPNTWHHAGKETGKQTWVPMANPDFIISRCAYDLSQGPLLLSGPVPEATYWSLAMYQNNSTNFFIVNDKGIAANKYEYVLARAGMAKDQLKEHAAKPVVYSPTECGYLVIRIFINPKVDYATLKATQEQASIQPLVH